MIPEQVRFTGLTVPTADLLFGYGGRKILYVPPGNWARVEITKDHSIQGRMLDKVDQWLAKTINGKWASHEIRHGSAVVILFEDDNDVILFKLMNGETAWKEELDPQLS